MMLAMLRLEPVAVDEVTVGIESSEEFIRDHDLPYVALHFDPAGDAFGADDFNFLAGCSLVDNSLTIGEAAAWRVDTFAIDALVNDDHIAWVSFRGGCRDRCQHPCRRSVVTVVAGWGDVVLVILMDSCALEVFCCGGCVNGGHAAQERSSCKGHL
jgi:hypothetical protein